MSAYVTWDLSTFDRNGEHVGTYGIRAVAKPENDQALSIAMARDSRVCAVEVRPCSTKMLKIPGVEGVLPVSHQVVRRVTASVTISA